MKRSDFLKRLVALPFVGKAVENLEIMEPDGVYVGLEPECELCDDDGYIMFEASGLQGQGIAYRPEGGYLPLSGGFQATQIPCPMCHPEHLEDVEGFLGVTDSSAFRDWLQRQKNQMMSKVIKDTKRHFKGRAPR